MCESHDPPCTLGAPTNLKGIKSEKLGDAKRESSAAPTHCDASWACTVGRMGQDCLWDYNMRNVINNY